MNSKNNRFKILPILVLIISLCMVAVGEDDIDKIINRLLDEQESIKGKREERDFAEDHSLDQERTETWEFVAEGVAAFSPGDEKLVAREQALKDALRNAVEQGIGIFLGSSTLVRNYRVSFDTIFTKAAGYVRTYEILDEWSTEGQYHVKVLAEVGMGSLQGDLMAIETFKRLMDYPRIMVFGKEVVDNEVKAESRLVQTAIESILVENGYDLVDRSQIETLKLRDIEMALNESTGAALGRRFGADILITYNAEAASAGKDILYGMRTYFYTGVVDVRVIKADTGRLMFSESVRVRRGSEGAPSAAQAALHFAGKSLGETLTTRILRSWAGEALEGGVWLELKIRNVPSFSDAMQLSDIIRGWQHINAVRKPAYIKQTAIYQVKANMTAPTLAELLSSLENPVVKIDEVMQNSIKGHIVRQ